MVAPHRDENCREQRGRKQFDWLSFSRARATSIKNFLQKRYFFFPASFPALAAAAFSARKVDVFSHIGPRNAAMVVAARAFADSSATISPALALRASDAACGGKKGREGAHEYN